MEPNNRAPSEFSSIFLVVPRDYSVVERAGESSQNVPGTLSLWIEGINVNFEEYSCGAFVVAQQPGVVESARESR